MRAGGSAASAVATNVMLSRMSGENNSGSSRPSTSTTSRRPPTTGTLRSILKVDSAMNWMTVTCQFAAATSAPRFSTVLTSTPGSIPAPIYSTLRAGAARVGACPLRPAGAMLQTTVGVTIGLRPWRFLASFLAALSLVWLSGRACEHRLLGWSDGEGAAPRHRRRAAGVRRAARGARTGRASPRRSTAT